MASNRRALSPFQRSSSYQNGNPFFTQPLNNNSHRFLLSGLFHHHKHHLNSRKLNHFSSWKKPLLRCSLFCFLGFLLGMSPFATDLNHDFTNTVDFDNNRLPYSTLVHSVKENNNYNNNNSSNSDSVDDVNIAVAAVELGVVSSVVVPRKQLIVVTPTYNRALQAYYLNRLGHVLRLVRQPVLWIVVEMGAASMETAEVLRSLGVMYRHLVCVKNSTDVKDRGVHQRNTAIEHIVRHRLDGVVYFADNDNVYSLELFENLRVISRFGTWPVGMLAQNKNKAILEGPVCNGSQVIGWHTNEKSKRLRRFHVDMSGFAFNSTILWDPKRWHRPTSEPIRQLDAVKEGFQETTFIEQIVEDESQMEGIPTGCHRIMNWHLHLEARGLAYPKGWMLQENLNAVIPVVMELSIS